MGLSEGIIAIMSYNYGTSNMQRVLKLLRENISFIIQRFDFGLNGNKYSTDMLGTDWDLCDNTFSRINNIFYSLIHTVKQNKEIKPINKI